jgi:hypothetical protein
MMLQTTNNPLSYCASLPNFGGFLRLNLMYSKDIVQQQFQSETELNSVVFRRSINTLAQWLYDEQLTAELKFEEILIDFGIETRVPFKATIITDSRPAEFREWWNKYIRGRRVAVHLINSNGYERIINPFIVTYTYVTGTNPSEPNRYELTFNRVRLIEYPTVNEKIIEEIVTEKFNYAGTLNNQVTIKTFADVSMSLFDFGYSDSTDLETVIYQSDPTSNILYNLTDGVYYFFAVNRAFPQLHHFVRADITDGIITIIAEDFDNPQIITENETIDDTGFVAPE